MMASATMHLYYKARMAALRQPAKLRMQGQVVGGFIADEGFINLRCTWAHAARVSFNATVKASDEAYRVKKEAVQRHISK